MLPQLIHSIPDSNAVVWKISRGISCPKTLQGFIAPIKSLVNACVNLDRMAAPLMTLHIAAYAESLATPGLGTLEGLLAGMRVTVNAEAAGPAESLIAGGADVTILALSVGVPRRGIQVMMMLPSDGARRGTRSSHGNICWRESLRQRALLSDARALARLLW